MRDIPSLDKNLLASEVEAANNLFFTMRNQGYAPAKITAMVYRAGRLDGREEADASKRKFHAEYHRLKERVKALEAALAAEPVAIIDDQAPLTTTTAPSPWEAICKAMEEIDESEIVELAAKLDAGSKPTNSEQEGINHE